MKDLTRGPIPQHLIAMAIPIFAGMVFQTLYFLVDLYFVAGLGDAPLAGVGSAGNLTMVIIALTQMLGVGTVALVSHAAGRKNQPEANLIFNQSVLLSALLAVLTLIAGYGLTEPYVRSLAADDAAATAGITYLHWYLPGLALQFAMVAMGSALRGTGIVKPTMMVQVLTVVLNTVFAPVFIAGWVTHHPFGPAGAGFASTLSVAIGVLFLWFYFVRLEHYVALNPRQWTPHFPTWKRILNIGLPAGGEMLTIFIVVAVIYWAIREFGPATQAGFGIAQRVMQALFVPVLAVSFAAAPVAGQNFGAGFPNRVRETFRAAASISAAIMLADTLLCLWQADWLIKLFSSDPVAIAVGDSYLKVLAWNFVATGLIFTCSSLFQALGNSWPSLISSGSRTLLYLIPAIWFGIQGHFELRHLWYASVVTVTLQAVVSLLLLQQQFRKRLVDPGDRRQPTGASANSGSVLTPPSDH
jgi:putative MATE family efflux protein